MIENELEFDRLAETTGTEYIKGNLNSLIDRQTDKRLTYWQIDRQETDILTDRYWQIDRQETDILTDRQTRNWHIDR